MLTISDRLSLLKMQWLTKVGQQILPPGRWHGADTSSDSNAVGTRKLYLTLDDGPCPETTETLLEIFRKENVKATFFLIGQHAKRHPALVKKIAADGHALGSHSDKHIPLPLLPEPILKKDLKAGRDAIMAITGSAPRLFRPPYGIIDNRSAECLKELEMEIVYWGAVPEDWQPVGSEHVIERVTNSLADGKIIVLHEGAHVAQQTILATQEIIVRAQSQGFTFAVLEPSSPTTGESY